MYLPKEENKKNLEKLYDNINWDLEYDKLYLSNKSKNEYHNKKHNIITLNNFKEESNTDYLSGLYYKYKLHIKNGGTKFGFRLYLIENNYLFECKCCKNKIPTNDIEILFSKNEIVINICYNCTNSGKSKSIKNAIINYNFKQRRKYDKTFKFKSNVRSLISDSFKRNKNKIFKKKYSSEDILGCKMDFFQNYIEKQFTEGMTFENYGSWHLDHIKPLALAKTEEDVIILNHYTNFQPLWAIDNLKKGSKY